MIIIGIDPGGTNIKSAIVNYIHVLDIHNIIVIGGVAKARDLILEPARKNSPGTLNITFSLWILTLV